MPQLYLQYKFLLTGQGSLQNGWIMFFSMLSIHELINSVVCQSVNYGYIKELNLLTFLFNLKRAWKRLSLGNCCPRIFFGLLLALGVFNFLYGAYLGSMLVLLSCNVSFGDAKQWWWALTIPYLVLQVYRAKKVRDHPYLRYWFEER